MAIQVLQQPPQIAFAGDPIVVKAKTTLSGKTFLRIKITVNATAFAGSEEFPYSESYSFEVGADGIAVFNIGETIKTTLSRKMTFDVNGTQTLSQMIYAARYTITYKESYLDGMVEIEEGETTSEQYNAIPGRLTEFERLTTSNVDTTEILGEGRILSRKPEGDIVPLGWILCIPAVSTRSDTITYSVVQGEESKEYSDYTRGALVPDSLVISTFLLKEGELTVNTGFETGKKRYAVKTNPLMRHFIFLNGFGLMESVVAFTRDSLEYDIQSELYTLPADISYRATTRTASYAQTPSGTFSMSSGFVNREWAEWWLTEFVVTRKAWMYDNGTYIPVAIIPEETNKLYDRAKPGLISVNFSVRYGFSGSTLNSFV